MSTIDFSTLLPERIIINGLPDGSSLTLIRREEMDSSDTAAFQALNSRMQTLDGQLKRAQNEKAAQTVVDKMSALAADILMALVAPETKEEARASVEALRMGHRTLILQHWTTVHQQAAAKKEKEPEGNE